MQGTRVGWVPLIQESIIEAFAFPCTFSWDLIMAMIHCELGKSWEGSFSFLFFFLGLVSCIVLLRSCRVCVVFELAFQNCIQSIHGIVSRSLQYLIWVNQRTHLALDLAVVWHK